MIEFPRLMRNVVSEQCNAYPIVEMGRQVE